jgi:hypothetical protein
MLASAARELLSKSIVSDQMWNCLVLSFVFTNDEAQPRRRVSADIGWSALLVSVFVVSELP